MRSSILKLAAATTLVTATVVAALVVLAHVPPVRARIVVRGLAWLRSEHALVAHVDRASYNLLTGDVHLQGLTLAAVGHEASPFLAAGELHARLPWSVLTGNISLQSLDITGLRISIIQRSDGSMNVPASQGTGAGMNRIAVGRLELQDASVVYRDEARDVSVEASGITARLLPEGAAGIVGPLAVATGPLIRVKQHESLAVRLQGQVAFDGVSLVLRRVIYEAPEGRLDITGRLSSILANPRADLDIRGDLGLSSLSAWVDLEPAARGTVAVTASVTGALADPVATIALDSDGVSWRHLAALPLRARATLTTSRLMLDSATLRLEEGALNARGHAALDRDEGQFHFDWRALPAAQILGPLAPFPIAARLQGSVDLVWDGAGAEAWRIAGKNDAEPIPRGRGIRIFGSEFLLVEGSRWRLRHDHEFSGAIRVTGEAAGRLFPESLSESTLGGDATVSVGDLSNAMPVVQAAGISVPAWLAAAGGTLASELRLSGTIASPSVSGTARVSDLYFRDVGPVQLRSDLAINTRRASIERLEATLGANHASASGSLEFTGAAILGAVSLDLPDLARFTPSWPAEWQPSGTASATFDFSGSISNPTIAGNVDGRNLAVANQQIDELTARLEYAHDSLVARPVDLRQSSGGYLAVAGAYSFSTGAYALETTGRDLTLQPLDAQGVWPAGAGIDVDFDAEGTGAHPVGAGQITFDRLSWRDIEVPGGEVDVALSERSARATARVPSLATTLSGTVGLTAPWPFTISADLEGADLARLVREASVSPSPLVSDLQGRADLTAAVAGTLQDVAGSSAVVTLRRLEVQVNHAAVVLARPAELQYARSRIDAHDLELRSGGTTLILAGQLAEPPSEQGLRAEVNGDLRDVTPWLDVFRLGQPLKLNMTGRVTANLAVNGSWETPTLSGAVSVEDAGISVSDLPAASGVSLKGTLAGGVVEVSPFSARWQGVALTGQGRIPAKLFEAWLPEAVIRALPVQAEEATLAARADEITSEALVPWLGAAASQELDGRASIAVDLRASGLSLEHLRGSVTVDQLDAAVAGVPLTQVHPIRLEVANEYLRIAEWTWDAAGNQLAVTGGLSLVGRRDLDLTMSGLADLRMVGAFVPEVTTGGLAEIALRVHGPIAAPVADGTLRLRDGELRVADPQIAISDVTGQVVLEGQRVRLIDVEGSANGGRVLLSGEFQYEGFVVRGGQVAVAGRGFSLNVPQGLRTEVDADLRLALADDPPKLSGTVTIRRGAYREPLSLAAGFVSAARQRAAVPGQASWLDQIVLDVEIASTEDLVVDNNYGRMDLGLDLRLIGSVDRPSAIGRAAIREGGVLYLGGRVYQIESGVIDFTSQTEIVPDLDITARTRISGYDITLAIAGTPDTLQGHLSSDPPLDQSNIVSLLVTGRMASDIGGAETAIAREQVLGYLSGEVLGFAAQAIGLDTLRLERGGGLEGLRADPSLIAGEADPSSRLTLSKSFSRYVEVVLSQDLRESGHLTWIVSYRPQRVIELRAVSRDDRSRSYGLNHQVSFGAPSANAPAGGTGADARTVTIADIRIGGTLGLPESDLRKMLTLQRGDRFDFYSWQRDRERLRQVFVERGYLEARVSARRIDAPGAADQAGIVIEYEINRGPGTILGVTGARLPGKVTRELEAIWSNAVFDAARLADMRGHLRMYLAGEGYLRAEVAATLAPPERPEQKVIRLDIIGGPRSTSREIRFVGNRVVPADRLNTLVADTNLGIMGWLDPDAIAREIEALYRNEGRLAARVAAGPAEFAGDRAVLPVEIDEGPAFSIADVTLSGVAPEQQAGVRRAFALEPGAAYMPGQVEAGRRAAEAEYRRQGFNAVRVSVPTEVDLKGATVRLAVRVEEGPQQLLQAVAIHGAAGVRPAVIARTLDFKTGDPVDMAAWYQARRRLSDTGLFSRVDIEASPVEQPAPAGTAAATEPVVAQVTVESWPAWRVRYGVEMMDEAAPAGESRRFGAGLTADVQRRALFGRAATLGVSARLNKDQRIGRAFLSVSRFFTLPVSSSLFLSRSRDQISEAGFLAFITDKTTVTAEQRFSAGRRMQVSYGYQFERNHTFDPARNPNDPLGLDLTVRVARLTSNAIIDTRDDPFDAIRGLLHSSSFEYAPEALGSDVRFVKYVLQQFFYRSIGGRFVSASAVRIGVGRGFGQDLIPSERFFAGGGNTVRGYGENSLGATDFFGSPRGGQGFVVLNQEARFPLFRWVRGVGFVDAGNVFQTAGDLSFTNLKVAVGIGLRLATPFGLFRLDLGLPLLRENLNRAQRFYFSLGQLF